MTETFYKIRHIPTGLFYKPSIHGSKLNLSKHGKVYTRKPNTDRVANVRWKETDNYHNMPWSARRDVSRFVTIDVIPSEWEIVRYETTEVERIPFPEE